METGSQGGKCKAVVGGEVGVPHLPVDKLGGTTGEQNRLGNPGFQLGEIKPKNL